MSYLVSYLLRGKGRMNSRHVANGGIQTEIRPERHSVTVALQYTMAARISPGARYGEVRPLAREFWSISGSYNESLAACYKATEVSRSSFIGRFGRTVLLLS